MSAYDELSQKLKHIIFILVVLAVVFKALVAPHYAKSSTYRGSGFSFTIPQGWERYRLPEMEKSEDAKSHMSAVVIAPSEQVQRIHANKNKIFKDIGVGEHPDTLVRIMSLRMEQPIWLDVHFEDILEQIMRSGLIIKDKGELKMQDEIVKWVLSETPGRDPRILLEFYIAPPQRGGTLLKIEYMTTPESFGKYRSGFEEARNSFKF